MSSELDDTHLDREAWSLLCEYKFAAARRLGGSKNVIQYLITFIKTNVQIRAMSEHTNITYICSVIRLGGDHTLNAYSRIVRQSEPPRSSRKFANFRFKIFRWVYMSYMYSTRCSRRSREQELRSSARPCMSPTNLWRARPSHSGQYIWHSQRPVLHCSGPLYSNIFIDFTR